MILDAKSNLAKLMATENIIVEQNKASTAHFNLETRTLVIPILKQDLSSDLYDLFIGHEVGHALNTPAQGWHDSITECGVNRSILNVCEDVRIEKLIRRKFPGLKSSFIRAYKELIDIDFFGLVVVEDYSELNLIDRINLHTKCGVSLGIEFEPAEAVLLEEAEQTETWEEVVEVAKRIQEFMKQQMEEKKQQIQDEQEASSEKKSESQERDAEGNGMDQETDGEDDESSGSTNGNDFDEEEIESKTDNAFREREKELHDSSAYDLRYGNIPNLDSKEFIVDYKDLYSTVHELSESHHIEWDTGLYTNFRKNTVKVVSYLTKEFELRKNADQHKRASVAKTGDLNMNRIYSYQFNEDIFKKMTIIPDGKSHGLVMFLDWSASMQEYLDDTIKQLLTLVLFCKNINIPFEVYAFSTQWDKHNVDRLNYNKQFKPGDLYFSINIKLLNLFSSRMSKVELSYAANVNLGGLYKQQDLTDFSLGCTPLNESIILAMDIVPKFQKKNHLQNVNTVFLTDGEGHSLNEIVVTDNTGRSSSRGGNLVLRDPKTQVTIRSDYKHYDTSKGFFHLLKQRTNCNIIGFRILSGRRMNDYISNFGYAQAEPLKEEFKKNKSCVVKGLGYDECYLLKSDTLSTDDEELEVKSTTTRGLVSAFKKYTKNNITNRVVLNRFIGLIS
jgi:hypothetical protein